MNGIRQNYARALGISPQRTEKFGVMHRDHMQSFFAAGVQPHRDFRIGKTDAIGHQQKQAVGGGVKAVAGRPGPGDQSQENGATGGDDGTATIHSLATTWPHSRAHKVPNTTTPSSTSIRGALTVVGCPRVPQRAPVAIANSRSATTGP